MTIVLKRFSKQKFDCDVLKRSTISAQNYTKKIKSESIQVGIIKSRQYLRFQTFTPNHPRLPQQHALLWVNSEK